MFLVFNYHRAVPRGQPRAVRRGEPWAVPGGARGAVPGPGARLPPARGLRGQRGEGGLRQPGRAQDLQRAGQGGGLHHRRGRQDRRQQRPDCGGEHWLLIRVLQF